MSLIEFIKQDIHCSAASLTGAVAGMSIPVADIITKIGIGIAIGVGTWCFTKSISWAVAKFKHSKCDCDNCKDK